MRRSGSVADRKLDRCTSERSEASVGVLLAGLPSARRCRRRPRRARQGVLRGRSACRRRSACARSSVPAARRARAAPRLHQLARHLDVALEADVAVVDHEALVDRDVVGEDARGHRRQVELVVVPLERGKARQAAEPFAPRAAIAHVDVQPADLGLRHARDARAQGLGHELPAEAMPDHGRAVGDRVAHERAQRRDPRQLVVDAHRAAHHADARIGGRARRDRRALVERDQFPRDALAREPRSEPPGSLGRRKAEDGDGLHGPPISPLFARPHIAIKRVAQTRRPRAPTRICQRPLAGCSRRYICLNKCVNCREIGSFSCRFLRRMNWRSASSRSTPDTASRLTIVPRCTCQNFSGIELRQQVLERRADQRLAARQHHARVLGVGLEVQHVGHGNELHLLADRRLHPLHRARRRPGSSSAAAPRARTGRSAGSRACARCAPPSPAGGRSRRASGGSRPRPPRTPSPRTGRRR